MKEYDAVISGYTCVDLIPNFGKNRRIGSISDFLVPGKLIEIEDMDFVLGGVVPNTGLAMKKFGKKVFLNGLIGNDMIGEMAVGLLRENDVEEGICKTGKANTAFSIVLSLPGVDRIFLESPGCNHVFDMNDIAYREVAQARLFHFGYPPLLRQFFINEGKQLMDMYAKVDKMGVVTSLDFSLPDSESESGRVDWLRIMRNTFPFVDIFVPSMEEVLRVMRPERKGIGNSISKELIGEIGEEIINMGVSILLIKAGEHGVYLFTGDISSVNAKLDYILDESWNNRRLSCKAFYADPDKIVNASGAGDTAIAAFLSAIFDREKPEMALKYAVMAGRNNLYCKNIYNDLPNWQDMTVGIYSERNEIIELSDFNSKI